MFKNEPVQSADKSGKTYMTNRKHVDLRDLEQKKAANAVTQMNMLQPNTHAALANNSGGGGYIALGGQHAPKAKKPPVAFNEEDLDEESENDWIRKMEAEW